MSKKIVIVQGSPRKNGNTRSIAAIAIAVAKENGASVTEIDAVDLKFKEPGCLGCQKCQESDGFKCVLNDEIAQKVATITEYDAIVLSTPIYWWSYPAQLKIFIDRMYSLSKLTDPENYSSALAGKTLGILATGGGGLEGNLTLLEAQWKNPADMLGSRFISCLFPNVLSEPGSLVKDPSAMEKAKEFGRALALS